MRCNEIRIYTAEGCAANLGDMLLVRVLFRRSDRMSLGSRTWQCLLPTFWRVIFILAMMRVLVAGGYESLLYSRFQSDTVSAVTLNAMVFWGYQYISAILV
jgi:hypothetical protein